MDLTTWDDSSLLPRRREGCRELGVSVAVLPQKGQCAGFCTRDFQVNTVHIATRVGRTGGEASRQLAAGPGQPDLLRLNRSDKRDLCCLRSVVGVHLSDLLAKQVPYERMTCFVGRNLLVAEVALLAHARIFAPTGGPLPTSGDALVVHLSSFLTPGPASQSRGM